MRTPTVALALAAGVAPCLLLGCGTSLTDYTCRDVTATGAKREALAEVIVVQIRAKRKVVGATAVERTIERTLFSFRTNKRIFNSVLALHRLEQWRRLIQRMATRSRYVLPESEVARYDALCSHAAVDVLKSGADACCIALDPTGRENIARAEHIRKRLRLLHRRRELTPALQDAILSRVVPALQAEIGAA